MANIGGVTGRLKLVIDDTEIDLGSVYLPLTVTRVSPEKAPYMHLGIGVDLDAVHDSVIEIFRQHGTTPPSRRRQTG